MTKKNEPYRLHMLRRLQNRYSQGKTPEMLEAEQTIAKLREQEARDREAIIRLSSPLPDDDLCPTCFFMRGHRNLLISVPHPDPARYDRWICRVCNYVDDIALPLRGGI